MLHEIAQATHDAIDGSRVHVMLWYASDNELEVAAVAPGPVERGTGRIRRRIGLRGAPLMTNLLLEPRTLLLEADEIPAPETDDESVRPARRALAAPLVVAGDVLGVLIIEGWEQVERSAWAMELAEEIAAHAALAVQNGRTQQQLRRRAEEQALLIRVGQVVMSGQPLPDVLSEVARACLSAEGVDGARIVIWHPATDEVEIAADETIDDSGTLYRVGERYPCADWPSYRAVMTDGELRAFSISALDVTARERANHLADGIRSVIACPIVAGPETLGGLMLHCWAGDRFGPEAESLARELAGQAAHAIDRARLFGQLRFRAETDGLTGLLNHRAAFETLDRELASARRTNQPLSLVVVDLDDFKLFNDTHGHLVGDRVLLELSTVLKGCVSGRGFAARYGGDEFLFILPRTPGGTADKLAHELVRRMEATTIPVEDLELPIRVSVGVATFPRDGGNRQELVAFADAAMYAAKELGGGQVGRVERSTRSLEPSPFGALSGLVRAVDRKDRYTKDHSDLVAEFSVRLGRALALSDDELAALHIAGQLHDVGKIAVPDSILRKPGHLQSDEEATIRQHVVFSELMIQGVPHEALVRTAVGHHHERWDGAGYPYGRSGSEIPLLGRILAIADAMAAMSLDRPYRKGLSLADAVREIRAGSGRQFDPELVEPFVEAVTSDTASLRDSRRRQVALLHHLRMDGRVAPLAAAT